MGTSNTRLSPRQKMINLMYIVLMAMLALNVSSDVLNGFTQVNDGLTHTNENIAERNASILSQLEAFSIQNPEKGASWFQKGLEVRQRADSLYQAIDSLKLMVITKADGPGATLDNIENREDLNAATDVMLNPATMRGTELRQAVDSFTGYITSVITDSVKANAVRRALSTQPVLRQGQLAPVSWEEYKFENQPAIAAVALLTKMQNDIKFAEGEALATLLANVDAGDVRVNSLNAYVIPQSRFVMRGGKYQANIILAAVDTTQRPEIYIGGKRLANENGLFEAVASSTGNFDYKGYLEVPHGDGSVTRHDFSSSYTVIEPSATVSATMMNVLYAGIDNPISISVPGVANSSVTATMTNGTLTRKGDSWIARPTTVGQDAHVKVTADMEGRKMDVADMKFRVRKLPDPAPYISVTDAQGNTTSYKGGGRGISKAQLMNANGIEAAIDDEILNIAFKVLSFETVFFDSMGNAIPENSDGANFSARQKQQFQRLNRGKRFYISRVKAVGPDGITRDIAPIEVIIN
ncbi:MAG: gliding motility protein GldM [Muribaculaceae bacterium]|nr:gliding motility protein GldM [Muribaculaceae bacterium]